MGSGVAYLCNTIAINVAEIFNSVSALMRYGNKVFVLKTQTHKNLIQYFLRLHNRKIYL